MKVRSIPVFLSIMLLLSSCKEEPASAAKTLYETQLFKAVQLAPVFKDSKAFVDLVPKRGFLELEKSYLAQKDLEGFDLQVFVVDNFEDRSMKALEFETDTTKTMYEHITLMWNKLTRGPDEFVANSSRIALPNKYVVPGGRFQEIYYWDSYFTLEGLLVDDRDDLAKNMVDNFSFLIDSIGFIPNGTRDYYNTRSQPPFYGLMVGALARKDSTLIAKYLPQLLKEYRYWMEGEQNNSDHKSLNHLLPVADGRYLNRYWDRGDTPRPEAYKEDLHLASDLETDSLKRELYKNLRAAAASGWDFSSRWYSEQDKFGSTITTSLAPVDLNCLLYYLESLVARAAKMEDNTELFKEFELRANSRKKLIQDYLWNEEQGFFMDYDVMDDKSMPHLTLAGLFPLYFNMATEDQAMKVKEITLNHFLKDGGLVTTLEHSGQQWDAPNGWAPLQWIAVHGLLNYGYKEEAMEIMQRWLHLNEKVYKDTGKMMEKYNVEDLSLLSGGGEYETQDGFGWTNGVALGFKKLLEELDE
ncbi:trehalase family glycosidase [Flagellimonas flava]|uniref:Alpha,alpha-trehalase n=1 Tax=Flagellimonas flava TaxID=570519 RepID=A0A1M5IS53_9FLAO|nr:trehalase family glycosidase [Allomuricauda flava]SHG31172.1 alpha,alpha-trehalase [Allomuricauda flava]